MTLELLPAEDIDRHCERESLASPPSCLTGTPLTGASAAEGADRRVVTSPSSGLSAESVELDPTEVAGDP